MGRFRKIIAPVIILLIIPLTIFVLQYTQIFKSRAATTPGSYGYGNFSQDVYGTSTVATPSATLAPPVTITPGITTTITTTPSVTVTSTPTPPVATSTPVPTPPSGSTILSLTVLLHNIGNSGDNVNPGNHSGSNKDPKHKVKTVIVQLFNNANQLTASASGNITYDIPSGSFKGVVGFDNSIASGEYTLKVKESTHLQRNVPGFTYIAKSQNHILPEVHLIAGDANQDNKLSILDFNFLDNCYGNNSTTDACTPSAKVAADFNDDGAVDFFDYNILLREFGSQTGE